MARLILAVLFAWSASLCLGAEPPRPKPGTKAKPAPAKPKPDQPKPKPDKPAPKPQAKPTPAPKPETLDPGTYALLTTAKGEILLKLEPDQAENTVANFVELAKGERPWKDQEGRWTARPFYDGLTFHRIEKDKLIQGGCPKGDGTGGPGYQFDNEKSDTLKFDAPGVVAMANAGRNTNGSQFFITLAATPAYDGDYTIFGKVVHGLDVVRAISQMPAKASGKGPSAVHLATKPVAIKTVAIHEVKPKPEKPDKPAAGPPKPPADK